MYQPKGFRDSENIIIIDNVPHFSYNGVTYKDKLKNGLSFEYVFQQEDMILPIMDQPISIEAEPDEFKGNYLPELIYEPEIKYIYRYDCDRICRMAYYSDDNDYDNDDDDDDDEASNLSS